MIPKSKWPNYDGKILSKISKLLQSGKTNYLVGKEGLLFEKNFSKFYKIKFANAVANASLGLELSLLSLNFNKGDEVIVTPRSYHSSVSCVIRAGLTPVFADVDRQTMNICPKSIRKNISKKTKAIMLINVLGISSNLFEISQLAKKNKLTIIEDNCESLGSRLKSKYLGTFGDFASFSFYYSHQITSGEGGMVVCKKKEDYDILFALRSHGWLGGTRFYKRNLSLYKSYAKKNPQLDPRYIFINSGFNLRPTDISAAIGYSQFKKLNKFKKIRQQNRNKIISSLVNSKNWSNQFSFLEPIENLQPSWFGFPIVLRKDLAGKKNQLLEKLKRKNIETRPIISGNFLNQPSVDLYNLNSEKKVLKNCQELEDRGFFIGLHTIPISKESLNHLTSNLLEI